MNREAGKGSKQRPTDLKKYDEGYDRIFRGGTLAITPFDELPHDAFVVGEVITQKDVNLLASHGWTAELYHIKRFGHKIPFTDSLSAKEAE